jgi:aminopeptidase N
MTFCCLLLLLVTTLKVAHEIAHSWTGNLVTNATWTHFWLNEGWTRWFEMSIMADIQVVYSVWWWCGVVSTPIPFMNIADNSFHHHHHHRRRRRRRQRHDAFEMTTHTTNTTT